MTTPNTTLYLRSSSQLAAGTTYHTAAFRGTPHIVVPIVGMIGNAVVRSMNSEVFELVPEDELRASVLAWNGRPVVLNHPNSGRTSANIPTVIDAMSCGYIFDADYSDGRLTFNAYIDPVAAREIGAGPLIDEIEAGNNIEVSVGLFARINNTAGVSPAGLRYSRSWHSILPDHLAILAPGSKGACSNEMGCGIRFNASYPASNPTSQPPKEKPAMNWIRRLLAAMEPSSNEIHDQLHRLLHSTEAAYDCLEYLYPESRTVIYTKSIDRNGNYNYTWWRRSYSINDNGVVTLVDDAVEVSRVVEFKPLEANHTIIGNPADAPADTPIDTSDSVATIVASNPKPSNGECSCTAATSTPKESPMCRLNELIANSASPFKEADRAALISLGEARINELADQFAAANPADPAPAPAPTPAPAAVVEPVVNSAAPAPAAPPAQLTSEQWLALAPVELRSMIDSHKAQAEAHRTQLIAQLTACQSALSADQLAAFTTEQLEGVLALSQPASYLGANPIVNSAAGSGSSKPAAPRIYDVALKAKSN